MIDYDKIIAQWQANVSRYCVAHGIQNIELKNLRTDDVYNYKVYSAYKDVQFAINQYRKTPESSVYAKQLVVAIKWWYALICGGKVRQILVRNMPNQVFARLVQYTK